MTWRLYLLLALLGVVVAALVAAFEPSPGYMDADYYYAGGIQLAAGHGFNEPYLWNYLDDPVGLPHPSNAYWMPLAALLAAVGAFLFGPASWLAARVGFLLVAGSIPPITAALAWSFSSRRDLSLISGLLAVFSAFYLPFLPVTDTFGLYMLFGGLFFLVLHRKTSAINPLLLGLLAGLMHLTRADGLLWLLVAFLAVIFVLPKSPLRPISHIISFFLLTLAGYLLVMTPWFIRNYYAFGAPLAPGSSKTLWLTSYDQLFGYPADQITFSAWLQSGLLAITRVRLWALGLNLSTMLSVQGEVVLLPLAAIGLWHMRQDRRIQLAVVAWLFIFTAMTFVFPFAGRAGASSIPVPRYRFFGGSLHLLVLIESLPGEAGSAPGIWSVRGRFFVPAWPCAVAVITGVIVLVRVVGLGAGFGWGQENSAYNHISSMLVSKGMTVQSIVMVANPPGFYLASGNPAIAVPDGDVDTLLSVASRYNAKYVILEAGSLPAGLIPVYENPQGWAGLQYLGDEEAARVFLIQP